MGKFLGGKGGKEKEVVMVFSLALSRTWSAVVAAAGPVVTPSVVLTVSPFWQAVSCLCWHSSCFSF